MKGIISDISTLLTLLVSTPSFYLSETETKGLIEVTNKYKFLDKAM